MTFSSGGETLSGTSTITNDDPHVTVQLAAVAAPSAGGSNTLPSSFGSGLAGEHVLRRGLGAGAAGAGSGDRRRQGGPGLHDGGGRCGGVVNHDYTLVPSGTIDDPNGVVRNLGGTTLTGGLGITPQWARWAMSRCGGDGMGEATFDLSAGRFAVQQFRCREGVIGASWTWESPDRGRAEWRDADRHDARRDARRNGGQRRSRRPARRAQPGFTNGGSSGWKSGSAPRTRQRWPFPRRRWTCNTTRPI